MKNTKTTTQQTPVMTLAAAFESIQAVSRGGAVPAWAGKNVYIGQQAKADWEAYSESAFKAEPETTMGAAVKKKIKSLEEQIKVLEEQIEGVVFHTAPKMTVEAQIEGLDSFAKLYADNKDLISFIANEHPESVAALARLVGRGESNVSRTLGKLASIGMVSLIPSEQGRTKRPMLNMENVLLKLELKTGRMFLAAA